VPRAHKTAALGRILDVEQPTSAIVFCRTRTEVDEVAETLNAQGYHAEALHGGLSQEQRDRVMKRFRAKTSELLVATDVAARGLDVQHVSHVVNYDVPANSEGYVHRIGRTGRAGRTGTAITLAEPREHRHLRNFERVTGQPIETAPLPTVADLKARRMEATQVALREAILEGGLEAWRGIVTALATEFDPLDVAAAAVKQAARAAGEQEEVAEIPTASAPSAVKAKFAGKERPGAKGAPRAKGARGGSEEFARLFVGGGRKLKIRPGDIVGAIANEAGLESRHIGRIDIRDDHTFIDLPGGMPEDILQHLQGVWVAGQKLRISRHRGEVPPAPKIKRNFGAASGRPDRSGPRPPPKSRSRS
jgi:ATP-dependent RNA helicase DeaD